MLSHYGAIRTHLHSQNELWNDFVLVFGKTGAPQGFIPLLLLLKTRWGAPADVTSACDFALRCFY